MLSSILVTDVDVSLIPNTIDPRFVMAAGEDVLKTRWITESNVPEGVASTTTVPFVPSTSKYNQSVNVTVGGTQPMMCGYDERNEILIFTPVTLELVVS